ncbi:SIR2 family protein, partial [Limnohabitans sp.]|uniref:SIR2 family protein n=1 Tax=Limnohabitans sp. TaxID=1907725 RepID=UPI00311E1A96
FGLVVAGYSGRDDSVMQALNAVLRSPVRYPKGIYWLCRDADSLLPAVRELLEQAELAQVDVLLVRGTTFDELCGDIADVTDLPSSLVSHVFGDRSTSAVAQVPLQRQAVLKAPVLRLSAMPLIEMPRSARKIRVSSKMGIADVRAILKQSGVRATVGQAGGPGVLAAFGPDAPLEKALAPLGAKLAGEVALDIAKDSWAKGVIYDALVRALCRDLPLFARLHGRGHSLSVSRPNSGLARELAQARRDLLSRLRDAYGSELTGPVPGTSGKYSEGLSIRLEQADERWWAVFEPATFIDLDHRTPDAAPQQATAEWRKAEDWRRERWVQKYNHRWSAILDAWVELLTHAQGPRRSAYGLAQEAGADAIFELGAKTARSRPAHDHDFFHVQRGQR